MAKNLLQRHTRGEGSLDDGVSIQGVGADQGLAGVLGLASRAVCDGAASVDERRTVTGQNAKSNKKKINQV